MWAADEQTTYTQPNLAFDTTSFLNQENKDKQLSQNILKTILPDAVRVQKTKVYMYKQKNIH
jgi:hypothetical protein